MVLNDAYTIAKYKLKEIYGWFRRSKRTAFVLIGLLIYFNLVGTIPIRVMLEENLVPRPFLADFLSTSLSFYLLISVYAGLAGFGFHATESETDFILATQVKPSRYMLGAILADIPVYATFVLATAVAPLWTTANVLGRPLWIIPFALLPLISFMVLGQMISSYLTAIKSKMKLRFGIGLKIILLITMISMALLLQSSFTGEPYLRISSYPLPNSLTASLIIGLYSQNPDPTNILIGAGELILYLAIVGYALMKSSRSYFYWSIEPIQRRVKRISGYSILSRVTNLTFSPSKHGIRMTLTLKELMMIFRRPETIIAMIFLPITLLLIGYWAPIEAPLPPNPVAPLKLNFTPFELVVISLALLLPIGSTAEWYKATSQDIWIILASPIKPLKYLLSAMTSLSTAHILLFLPILVALIILKGVTITPIIVSSIPILCISTWTGAYIAIRMRITDFQSIHISPKLVTMLFFGYLLAAIAVSPILAATILASNLPSTFQTWTIFIILVLSYTALLARLLSNKGAAALKSPSGLA